MRETSIIAFQEIKRNGLLSKRQLEVYQFILNNEPVCSNDVTQKLCPQGHNSGAWNTRVTELFQKNVIEVSHVAKNPYTGFDVTYYVTNGKLPQKKEKRISKYQKAKKLLLKIKKQVSGAFLGPELMNEIEEFLNE